MDKRSVLLYPTVRTSTSTSISPSRHTHSRCARTPPQADCLTGIAESMSGGAQLPYSSSRYAAASLDGYFYFG